MVPSISTLEKTSLRYFGEMLFGALGAEMKGSGENPRDLMGFMACGFFFFFYIYTALPTH